MSTWPAEASGQVGVVAPRSDCEVQFTLTKIRWDRQPLVRHRCWKARLSCSSLHFPAEQTELLGACLTTSLQKTQLQLLATIRPLEPLRSRSDKLTHRPNQRDNSEDDVEPPLRSASTVPQPSVVIRASRPIRSVSAWIAALAFIVNSHWCVLPKSDSLWSDLGIGYFFWWLSLCSDRNRLVRSCKEEVLQSGNDTRREGGDLVR